MSMKWRYLAEILIGGLLVDAAIYASFCLWPTFSQRLGLDRRRREVVEGNRSYWVQVLFFPEEKTPCRRHYERQVTEGDSGCADGADCPFSHEAPLLDQMFGLLRRVKSSLDVCVFSISSYELCSAILAIHARGVRVRIIVDGNFCDDSKSKIGRCRAQGIPVRSNNPGSLMHHKFLILDGRILMNGSLNWTWQGVTMNSENVMLTDCQAMVEPYIGEFERLWKKFDPIRQK